MTVSQFKHICGFNGDFQLYIRVAQDPRNDDRQEASELQMVLAPEFVGDWTEGFKGIPYISIARHVGNEHLWETMVDGIDVERDEKLSHATFDGAYEEGKRVARRVWGSGR